MSAPGTPQKPISSVEKSAMLAGCSIPRIWTPHTIGSLSVKINITATIRIKGSQRWAGLERKTHLQWETPLCPSTPSFTRASRLSSIVNFSMMLSPLILNECSLSLLRTPKILYTSHANCHYDIYLDINVDVYLEIVIDISLHTLDH